MSLTKSLGDTACLLPAVACPHRTVLQIVFVTFVMTIPKTIKAKTGRIGIEAVHAISTMDNECVLVPSTVTYLES
jgi:hypothetical protein